MTPQMDVTEIARRGNAIYDSQIRKTVESGNKGRIVAIDVDTGEWELGDDLLTLSDRLHAHRPSAQLFAIRVGYPALERLGFVPRRTEA